MCWEKFARYFDVEPRYVPLTPTRFIIGVDEAMALVDENTIGVVGILGSTYTGEYEPIAELDAALTTLCDAHNQSEKNGGAGDANGWVWDVPLHVDAASGGFVAPFLTPELLWDFRLPRVRSINVSGHKYGLVYPGVGWVLWRESSDLPSELIFEVDYLGGSHANFGLNFSRGAAQIVAQYYNLIRLGRQGYTQIMEALAETAHWLAAELGRLDGLEIVTAGTDLPVVCVRLADDVPFSVFDLADRMRLRGWVVPAYRMAADAQAVAVLRFVVREGLLARHGGQSCHRPHRGHRSLKDFSPDRAGGRGPLQSCREQPTLGCHSQRASRDRARPGHEAHRHGKGKGGFQDKGRLLTLVNMAKWTAC